MDYYYNISQTELDMFVEKIAPYFKEEDEPLLKIVYDIYMENSYNNDKFYYIEEITKIDNVNVSVAFRYGKYTEDKHYIQISIEFTDTVDECGNNIRLMLATYNIGEILTMKHVKIMMYLLNHVKYDKLNGKFIPSYIASHVSINKLFKAENIETDINECCVCYEETKTLTECGHPLCYECHSKIKEINNGEGDEYKQCPICRKNIDWKNINGHL